MTEAHDASKFPLADRVAYATVVGSMAAADDVVSSAELDKLKALCASLGLPAAETQTVIVTAEGRDPAAVHAALDRIAKCDLRYTLYTDCLLLAYADDQIVADERAKLADIAEQLDIDEDRAAALEEYVQVAHDAVRPGADHAAVKQRAEAVGAKLAALGVPVGAVAIGSAAFLGAAGIATGLAAVAAGLGIATGFGAVIGLGVGTIYGVRWLHHKLAAKHAPTA